MASEDEPEQLSAQDQQGFAFETALRAPAKEPGPHDGHRDRLRQRFLKAGHRALSDHELIELLMFSALPRVDTKPLAKELLEEFGTLEELVAASPDKLRKRLKKNDHAISLIKLLEATSIRLAEHKARPRRSIASHKALVEYCTTQIARLGREQFRVLYLDTKLRLIEDVLLGEGTIDHAPVYIREIVSKGLYLEAKSMILVHNHPSGDPEPSQADVAMTREIVSAAKPMNMLVHDHLVIGRHGTTSFKDKGLI